MTKEINTSCYMDLHSRSGVSNSFSAVGQIYIPGFYTGQILFKKKFKQTRLYINGPQTFCLEAQETS